MNNMIFENEITVEVDLSIEELKKKLKENNFVINEEYDVIDVYMVKDEDVNDTCLEILKKCILIRNIITKKENIKRITYKYKEYNEKEEIIKQGKINCGIDSIDNAISLFEAIGYKKLIKINDHLIVYSNDNTELVVQLVNNKHIYIEMEENCEYIDKKYNDIEEMINDFNKYNIPIKNNNYFVKKAEIELIESNKV